EIACARRGIDVEVVAVLRVGEVERLVDRGARGRGGATLFVGDRGSGRDGGVYAQQHLLGHEGEDFRACVAGAVVGAVGVIGPGRKSMQEAVVGADIDDVLPCLLGGGVRGIALTGI